MALDYRSDIRCWRNTLAAVLLGCCPAQAVPAQDTSALLDGAGLVADVDLLERAYTTLHPGLYRYATPAQVTQRFAELRSALGKGANKAEVFLALSRFAATVKCGHTQVNFFNQSDDVKNALLESGRGRLPFHFRWLDGEMVIVRNGPNTAGLVPGTAVTAINRVSTATILARLLTVARADGSNDEKRIAQMEVLGRDRYEAFDVYLPLLFPEFGETFELRIRTPADIAERSVSLPGISYAERLAMRGTDEPEVDEPAWSLQYPHAGVALLAMPNWALFNSKWDWRSALQATFVQLARDGTSSLIIDLRGNEGGVGVGDELLAYLTPRPLPLIRYQQRVRYRAVPEALRPHLKTWDASFNDWGDYAKPFDARYLTLTRWQPADSADVIQPKSPRYAGQVFVLVDAANSSATFEFANQIKASGLARLVGQTTGGNRRGINGSAFFFLELPNSGIELDLPLVAQFPQGEQPDAGVEPDLHVELTAADIANGKDPVMDTTIWHATH